MPNKLDFVWSYFLNLFVNKTVFSHEDVLPIIDKFSSVWMEHLEENRSNWASFEVQGKVSLERVNEALASESDE